MLLLLQLVLPRVMVRQTCWGGSTGRSYRFSPMCRRQDFFYDINRSNAIFKLRKGWKSYLERRNGSRATATHTHTHINLPLISNINGAPSLYLALYVIDTQRRCNFLKGNSMLRVMFPSYLARRSCSLSSWPLYTSSFHPAESLLLARLSLSVSRCTRSSVWFNRRCLPPSLNAPYQRCLFRERNALEFPGTWVLYGWLIHCGVGRWGLIQLSAAFTANFKDFMINQ